MSQSQMPIKVYVLLSLICVTTFTYRSNADGATSWCNQNQTPYMEQCKDFSSQNHKSIHTTEQRSNLLKASLVLAFDRATYGKTNIYQLGSRFHDEREKAAWSDCLELYDATIDHINKTMDPYTEFSPVDTQTWLSAAMTNLETCQVGFEELDVVDNIFHTISRNVTELIANALALNKDSSEFDDGNGFPSWVSPKDEKLLLSTAAAKVNIVVAQDGSGKYRTVSEAISAAEKGSNSKRHVIRVKGGTYKENIQIRAKNVMLVGDGIGKTLITGSKSVGGGSTTFNSATVAVTGSNFIAQGITFRNTAGAANGQAVALRSSSDFSVFYQCSFEGYQDTLYVHSNRQFYKNCHIYGTVDYIFGNAAVVFQNCNIYSRSPPSKTNTITAQGRSDPNQNTGISIHNCKVTAASDLKSSVRTYLGRPWRKYSRTVFMKTYLDSLIDPAGWLAWNGDFALSTLYYGEYKNTGPRSSTRSRVKWGGYHVITSPTEASIFTVGKFINGGSWLPATGVPYSSGL